MYTHNIASEWLPNNIRRLSVQLSLLYLLVKPLRNYVAKIITYLLFLKPAFSRVFQHLLSLEEKLYSIAPKTLYWKHLDISKAEI